MSTSMPYDTYRKEAVLLLTATIQAGNIIYCDRRDTQLRLDDYLHAFRFWIGESWIRRIILVENSGYCLTAFRDLIRRRARDDLDVELLSFVQAPFDPSLGKSYGEAKIIEHAMRNSRLLAESSFVIKCTGRYYATNFFRIWPTVQRAGFPYVLVNYYQFPDECDSRCFGASGDFFTRYFSSAASRINDSNGHYFERALADAVRSANVDGHEVRAFPGGGMLVDGIQASTNSAYRYPYLKRLAYRFVAGIRNGLPLRLSVGAPIHRPGQGSKT